MATYAETLAKLNELCNEAQKDSFKKRSGSRDQAYECGKQRAYEIALQILRGMEINNE